MAVAAEKYDNPELAERRLLTEPNHFLDHMDDDGNVPDDVFDAVAQNRGTGICEIGIPGAVTDTIHEVTEETAEDGEPEQIIWWLGKTAVDVAMGGYKHHFSQPAFKRTGVEVSAARFQQKKLRPGMAQSLIEPAMSEHDAPVALAKAENLHGTDSIQVSTAIANIKGQVTHRKLRSLLVSDVPLSAWVAMCEDPGNIFGKALIVRNKLSAVSIMELFDQIELPEEMLPNGPVTLVEAVAPYIDDELARQKVKHQIEKFRSHQEFYAREAEQSGREWAMFDLELARSLKFGQATDPIRFFLMQNADAWSEDSLQTIESHQLDDADYAMTTGLAALLARAKQKLLGDRVSVVTDNEAAIKEVSLEARHRIKATHEALQKARANNADVEDIRRLERQEYQQLHKETIDSGGGCPGEVESAFGGTESGVGENSNPFTTDSKENWKWKRGVCQVKACPSPKPTEVGPCSVCRRCQKEFDAGRDPTLRSSVVIARQSRQVGATALGSLSPGDKRDKTSSQPSRKDIILTAA